MPLSTSDRPLTITKDRLNVLVARTFDSGWQGALSALEKSIKPNSQAHYEILAMIEKMKEVVVAPQD